MSAKWMIYGVTGFTGELIAEESARRGLKPVVAGRNRSAVEAIAGRYGLESRIFGLDDVAKLREGLRGITAVVHCAGPFSATSAPMLDACIAARAHYLDITGEIEVFEAIQKRSPELESAGIAAIPGAGFDVVPSDCMAAMLKRELPDACVLRMAFKTNGRVSIGTAKSMVEGLALGSRIREDGSIVRVPWGARRGKFRFGRRTVATVAIPWGDVSTAFYSTGIPNIEVHAPMSGATALVARVLATALSGRSAQRKIQFLIGKIANNPSTERRARSTATLVGYVENARGVRREMQMRTPDGYDLTVDSAIECVQRLLANPNPPTGFVTPSQAFGPEFALALRGVSLEPSASPGTS